MQLVLAQWISGESAEALKRYGEEWQASTVHLVEVERAKSELLLKELGTSLPLPPDPQSGSMVGLARQRMQARVLRFHPRTDLLKNMGLSKQNNMARLSPPQLHHHL